MAEALTVESMPAPHGFFTRRGGLSTGPYASLNCNLGSPDDRDAVLQNRARVAQSLGVDPAALLGVRQVHGAAGVTVAKPWPVGPGAPAAALVPRLTASGPVSGEQHATVRAGEAADTRSPVTRIVVRVRRQRRWTSARSQKREQRQRETARRNAWPSGRPDTHERLETSLPIDVSKLDLAVGAAWPATRERVLSDRAPRRHRAFATLAAS